MPKAISRCKHLSKPKFLQCLMRKPSFGELHSGSGRCNVRNEFRGLMDAMKKECGISMAKQEIFATHLSFHMVTEEQMAEYKLIFGQLFPGHYYR